PIKKGDKVGYVTVQTKDGKEVPFLTSDGNEKVQVDLVANETVEKANWFVLAMRGIGSFFSNVWGSVSDTVKGWF
ncbi:MAG TPA: D-alanyl-D-alanine carboxypeptidase, partial [Ureibacillus sp.]|nr:D-alanyl-D-alanine carboxypeptidase [Ureibacillus sp.]